MYLDLSQGGPGLEWGGGGGLNQDLPGNERKSGRPAAPGNQSQNAQESTSEDRDSFLGAGRALDQLA